MREPHLREIRAANPRQDDYDPHVWEAYISALYTARCVEMLAEELRRVACAPPDVREMEIVATTTAWHRGQLDLPVSGALICAHSAHHRLNLRVEVAFELKRFGKDKQS